MKRLPLLLLALLLSASGCVQYRLSSMLPPDVRTVYMPTCDNQTREPLIEQDVTQAILSQIQMDGSLRLAPADTADTRAAVPHRIAYVAGLLPPGAPLIVPLAGAPGCEADS